MLHLGAGVCAKNEDLIATCLSQARIETTEGVIVRDCIGSNRGRRRRYPLNGKHKRCNKKSNRKPNANLEETLMQHMIQEYGTEEATFQ
jgi:uncharacterized protein YceH (UPF0502 family)